MAIDGSEGAAALGTTNRIGEVRRVEREMPPKHPGEDGRRGKRDGHSTAGSPQESPHDVIDISAPAGDDPVRPPTLRPPGAAPLEPEHHLDINV